MNGSRVRCGASSAGLPQEIVSIRLDKDVLAFYRSQGAGYQTRINDTLRAAMQAALSASLDFHAPPLSA